MKKQTFILLAALGLLTAGGFVYAQKAEPQSSKPSPYMKAYQFSRDAFTWNIPLWSELLKAYKGLAGVRYLEIGIFEGRSFLWMLENILTGEGSQATGIDTFTGPFEKTFRDNLALSGLSSKAVIRKGRSQVETRTLPRESFDIIYVDGSHLAHDVMADAVMAFELLKTGGVLIFDDYEFSLEYPPELRPRIAVDAFVSAYRNRLEILHKGTQMIVRKQPFSGPCRSAAYCTPFGEYGYSWKDRVLYGPDQQPVQVSDEERLKIEKFAASRSEGETLFTFSPEWEQDAVFQALLQRLGQTPEKLRSLGREIPE